MSTGTGLFWVIEGGDACGKTTQVRLLAERLRRRGRTVVETLEPGGTPLGAAVREIVLGDGGGPVDDRAEALLMAADRAQHVAQVVRPALERGDDVVSDRYVPSSLVYQGVGRGLGVGAVEALSRWATAGLEPDLVIVLDVDDATVAIRAAGTPDRMERAGDRFHSRVRDAYRRLARERGWALVDGSGPAGEVEAAVWEAVAARVAGRVPGPDPGRGP